MEYHVSKCGSDQHPGTEERPFLSINRAAAMAKPGDVVTVHEGTYRECVNPMVKGLSPLRSITYQAAEGENAVIKGSEEIKDWELVEGTVWKASLPNGFFGDYNPYTEELWGDWLLTIEETRHLGDVYLNGMSFYEVGSFEALLQPEIKTETLDHWTNKTTPVQNPPQTRYVWMTENDGDRTTIYANFHEADPREECVEINVRKACFYPEAIGIDYIVVRGFEMAHAATPWAPPTADQPGLLGVHWSKGWIIENNIIHDSKCSAISIGKEISTGHHYRTERRDKPGYLYQLESVFAAGRYGWSKENIGSHVIRNNTIFDCGQNAIVGHLGCVFSEIYNNHIYNIAIKREFYGHEIAGIKLHAPIDVQIYNNRIHDCSLGLWLDWETQGTRISQNLFYRNNRDFFVEVSHGPFIVDHNIFTSEYAIDNHAQGGAYVNNLIGGKMFHRKVLDRATQYHLPHSTEIAGFAFVYGGDDRFYNNIFIGKTDLKDVGTSHYNGYAVSLDDYIEKVHQEHGDSEIYDQVEQPVYINNNAYFNGAEPFDQEEKNLVDDRFDPQMELVEEADAVYLCIHLPDEIETLSAPDRSTETLPRTRIVDAEFEQPDGAPICLDRDFLGEQKGESGFCGPIGALGKGRNRIRLI